MAAIVCIILALQLERCDQIMGLSRYHWYLDRFHGYAQHFRCAGGVPRRRTCLPRSSVDGDEDCDLSNDFQVVSDVTAAESGIRNTRFLIASSLFAIAAGNIIISARGEFQALMILGCTLLTIGSGMIFKLEIGSPSRVRTRYQVMAGIGCGLSMQLAVIVSQAVVDPVDIASISSVALFFQMLGGAVSVSVAQVIFTNTLTKALERNVPGLDPRLVTSTGATELRKTMESDQLHGAIKSYMKGPKDTYAVVVALAGAAVVVGALAAMFDRRRLHKDAKPW